MAISSFSSAIRAGLANLKRMIESDGADRVVKELSSVEVIEPITPTSRRSGAEAIDIRRRSPRRRKGFLTRVKLFDYGPDPDQDRLRSDFIRSCEAVGAPVRRAGYATKSFTFEVECRAAEQVEAISRIVGVRSIGPMPLMRQARPQVFNTQALPRKMPKAADFPDGYPVVAVVDSGITDANEDVDLTQFLHSFQRQLPAYVVMFVCTARNNF